MHSVVTSGGALYAFRHHWRRMIRLHIAMVASICEEKLRIGLITLHKR